MLTKSGPVIVKEGACAACAVPTKQVHHRDFPEIWSEAGTAIEALAHLAKRLSSARDGARSEWQRGLIEHAITDISEFLETLVEKSQHAETPCRCSPRGLDPSASAQPMTTQARKRASKVGSPSRPARRRPTLHGSA
jgi:hypothetical protein